MAALWRIVKRRHAASAFDGEGARRFGGRWNSPGHRAVYASGSKALALLEVLVHLDVARPIPRFVAFTLAVNQAQIEICPVQNLPRDWRSLSGVAATRRLGDAWLAARRTVALAVPSVIVPEELSYVLNPMHPAFARLSFGAPTPFQVDRRLL